MSEHQPVLFEQQTSAAELFGSDGESVINQFIGGLQNFGNNVNVVAENLISFLEYAKFILKTLRDPLALVLIPLLDALIAELEDLKNIGIGSLTIWPWECGTLAPPVDTSKLEEGLDALAFYLLPDSEKKNKQLVWNPTSGYGLVDRKNNSKSKLSRVDDLVANPQSTNVKNLSELGESKHFLLDVTRGIREFLDPSTWEGPFDQGVATFLEGLKTGLNKRQLNPEEVIDKIIDSFNDSNDQLRPTGKGDYQAMVLMFTLPSMSDLNQLVTAFSDYFGGVLSRNFKEGADKSSDSDGKRVSIELGPPLIFDVETSYDIEQKIRKKQLSISQITSEIESGLLPLQDEFNLNEEKKELVEEVADLQEDLELIRKNGSKESKNSIFFMNNVKINKDILLNADGTPLNLLIDANNPAPDWFPTFKKGDNIVQGRSTLFGPSFMAKVINHGPIQISNGKVIRNTLTVQGVRGRVQQNRSTRGVGSAGVIRRMDVLKDEQTKQVLVTGGPSSEAVLRKIPLYQPADAIISEPVPADIKFIGTIKEGENLIDHILPVTLGTAGANEALAEILREARDANGREDFIIGSYENAGPPDKRFVTPRDRLKKIETEMISFLENLSIGLVVRHTYLNTGEWKLPEEISEATSDVSVKLKKLATALPGFGINYHVGEILIKDSIPGNIKTFIPGRAKEMLFDRNSVSKEIIRMNIIQIKLGRLVSDGSYETQGTAMAPFINVPENEKKFFEFNRQDSEGQVVMPFETFRFSGGRPPNWKFIRIQDFLPAYGTFIDDAISLIERGKGYVQSGLKFLDNIIERLQDEIDAIKKFNKTIQQLIQLLSAGFNGAGFYTLSVTGSGGVNDFKRKLGRAKFLKKGPNTFPEISLETTKKSVIETNPFTGLEEEKFITGMKPVLKTVEDGPKGPRIVEPSELSNLKYSGAVVFYGQANDSAGFAAWMKQLEAARSLGMSFIGNLLGTGDSFAEKLRPKVDRVLVQDKNGDFFNSDDNTKKAKFDTIIRVVLKNEAHTLTKEERDTFEEIQGRQIDYSPTVITSTLNVTNSDTAIDTSSDVFCLYKGETPSAQNCIQLQNAFRTSLNEIGTHNGNPVHEFTIDLVTKSQSLPASNDNEPTYKLHITESPMTSERLKLKGRTERKGQPGRDDLAFNSAIGFKIEKTSLLSLELNNAI